MSKTRRIIKIILNSILLALLVAILALLIYAQVYTPKTQALDNNQSTSNVADLGSGVYCGKTLFNESATKFTSKTLDGGLVVSKNNDYFNFNGRLYGKGTNNIISDLSVAIPAGTYTLSFANINGSCTIPSGGWFHIDFLDTDNNLLFRSKIIGSYTGATCLNTSFTLDSSVVVSKITIILSDNCTFSSFSFAIQIEQGNIATAYEPYFTNRDTFYQKFDYDMFNYIDNGIIVGGFIYDYNYKYSLTIPSNFLDSFDITNKLSLFVMADDGVNVEYLLYSRRSPGITFTVDIVDQSHISKNSTIVLFVEGDYPNITSDMITGLVFKAIPVDGINDAYDAIYNDGYNAGLSYGSGDGYNRGYAVGRSEGMAVGVSSWNNLFPSIFGGIAGFFRNTLDIPILGTNLLTIVGTVGAIFIALSVIRLIIK